jgi:16S rRNA (guanine527-N7)-methyltransferase
MSRWIAGPEQGPFSIMLTKTPSYPTESLIRKACGEFQLELDAAQVACVQQYMRMLLAWNEKVNLTAIRDPLEILYRHFCESLFAAVAVPLERGRLADVGSGGGFPGLPLKIIRPELEVFLIESNIKKATFLAEVVRELGLNDMHILVSRYQDLGEEVAPLEVVCSRALGDYGAFLKWAASVQVAANQVVLWIGGRDLDEVRKVSLWDWLEPIAVPQSLQRFLLVGTKREELITSRAK